MISTKAKKVFPNWLKPFAKKVLRTPKRIKVYENRLRNEKVTKEMLLCGLKEIGIGKGDVLEVHSSLSSFGYVEGGANTIIEALIECVGESGTILMPTFHGFNPYNIHQFDVKKTNSVVGSVTNCFRKYENVERNLHPTHSVAVYGKHSKYLIEDSLKSPNPFDKYSPFYRLLKLNGKIVCLGVDIDTISFYHVIEDSLADYPKKVYLPKVFELESVDKIGKVHKIKTKAHDPKVHDYCIDGNPAIIKRLKKHFRKEKIIRETSVGMGYCCSLQVRGVYDCLRRLAKKDETTYAQSAEEQGKKIR